MRLIDADNLIEELQGGSIVFNIDVPKSHLESALTAIKACTKAITDAVENQPKIGEWIPCSERMPEEHKSMFAKLKGTDKWQDAMFESMSDDVNATVEFENGNRKTMTLHTCDGKWMTDNRIVKFEVIAWQPLPEPYKEDIAP